MVYIYYLNKCFSWFAKLLSKHIPDSIITNYSPYEKTNALFIIFYSDGMAPILGTIIQNYIIIQMEQYWSKIWQDRDYLNALYGAKQIWDYSKTNIQKAPFLLDSKKHYFQLSNFPSEILKVKYDFSKPINFFFVGSMSKYRMHMCAKLGVTIIRDKYDEELYSEIMKMENPVLINIHYMDDHPGVLEIVRIMEINSYGVIIVSEYGSDPLLEASFEKCVHFADLNTFTSYNCPHSVIEYRTEPIIPKLPEHELCDAKLITPFICSQKFNLANYMEWKKAIVDLPNITVLIRTTKSRQKLIPIVLYNLKHINYPKDKVNIITLDDKETSNIVEKLNIGVAKTKTDIIIVMDDDDYHHPESFLIKVYSLTNFENIKVVGNIDFISYNLGTNKTNIVKTNFLAEGTMALIKSKFHECDYPLFKPNSYGESYELSRKFMDNIMLLPNALNVIAITHSQNYTGRARNYEVGKEVKIFPDDFYPILKCFQ